MKQQRRVSFVQQNVPTQIVSTGFPNDTGFPLERNDGMSLRIANADAYKSVFVFNLNHHPYFSPHVVSKGCVSATLYF